MTTLSEARDAVLGAFRTAWLANPSSSAIPLVWDDVEGDKPAGAGNEQPETWARATAQAHHGEQISFGAAGARRYDGGGTFTVQLFTPAGRGHTQADLLAAIVLAMLRTPVAGSTVWFFEPKVIDVGRSGPWYQTNVKASWRYEEIA